MREMEMYDTEIGKIRDKNLSVPIENQMSGRMIEIENPSGGDVKLDAFIFTMNRNQFGWWVMMIIDLSLKIMNRQEFGLRGDDEYWFIFEDNEQTRIWFEGWWWLLSDNHNHDYCVYCFWILKRWWFCKFLFLFDYVR